MTGAPRGIGRTVAEVFVRAGATVIACNMHEEKPADDLSQIQQARNGSITTSLLWRLPLADRLIASHAVLQKVQ
jgi:NAD(P)-dependent dehydrogenase (short-subunit alcohol dehydrogenase family)